MSTHFVPCGSLFGYLCTWGVIEIAITWNFFTFEIILLQAPAYVCETNRHGSRHEGKRETCNILISSSESKKRDHLFLCFRLNPSESLISDSPQSCLDTKQLMTITLMPARIVDWNQWEFQCYVWILWMMFSHQVMVKFTLFLYVLTSIGCFKILVLFSFF